MIQNTSEVIKGRKLIHGGDIYSIYENAPQEADRLVDFSANISPLGIPDAVLDAVKDGLAGAVYYPDPQTRRLKDAIGAFLEQVYGVSLPRACIVCGNGAADVIYRFVLAKKPKTALLCAPTFGEYEEALALWETKLSFYQCPKESLEIGEDILDAVHPGLDVMFLCNPNNPTGLLLDGGLLARIVEKTRENHVLLVMDECFLDFVENEEKLSVIPLLSQNKHILVLKSFTKMYGMAGLRLGYGLSADQTLIGAMEKCGQPWAVSTAAESAGVAALKDVQHPKRVRQCVALERKFLMEAFLKLGIHFFDSRANYILIKLPGVPHFYERMLAEGILVRRCENYRNLDGSYYRVAVNSHEKNERLVAALRKVVT